MHVTMIERSPGSWRLRIECGRGEDGKRQFEYETVHGSEEDAKRKRFEILKAHEDRTWSAPSKLTFGPFFAEWLAKRRELGTITVSTERTYGLVAKHALSAFGGERLQKIGAGHIEHVYRKLLASGMKPSSVRQLHRLLRTVFNDAKTAKLVAEHPMEGLKPPKVRKSRAPKALDEQGVRTILAAVKGNWKEDIVRLALGTGLRRGELCGLRWRDIDLAKGLLRVDGQVVMYSATGYCKRTAPKTETSYRALGLSADDIERLQARRVAAAETALAAGTPIGDLYVFGGAEPMSPDELTISFSRMCDAIGLGEFTFHSLRHTHITMLFRGRADPAEISARVGHGSIAFTRDVYQSVFEDDMERLGALANELFKKYT